MVSFGKQNSPASHTATSWACPGSHHCVLVTSEPRKPVRCLHAAPALALGAIAWMMSASLRCKLLKEGSGSHSELKAQALE